jgi:hypothetical protein
MAKLQFSSADVAALLGLKDCEAVDGLVRAGVLEVTAYTPRGRPLYSAETILRAAKQVRPRSEPSPEQASR